MTGAATSQRTAAVPAKAPGAARLSLSELVREVDYQLVFHRPRQRVLFVLLEELNLKGELNQIILAMKFTIQHVLY